MKPHLTKRTWMKYCKNVKILGFHTYGMKCLYLKKQRNRNFRNPEFFWLILNTYFRIRWAKPQRGLLLLLITEGRSDVHVYSWLSESLFYFGCSRTPFFFMLPGVASKQKFVFKKWESWSNPMTEVENWKLKNTESVIFTLL